MFYFVLFFGFLAISSTGTRGTPIDSLSNTNVETRIIGGIEAPSGFAPHMVALGSGETVRRIFCGGSIISIHYILTAAHCIDAAVEDGVLIPSLSATIGSNRWDSVENLVKISNYMNHPEWDSEMLKYDVGVLCATEPMELNEFIAVIPLELDWVDGGEESYVTGWGMMGPTAVNDVVNLAPIPDLLQLLHVKTITPNECKDGMAEFAVNDGRIPPINPDLEICTFHSFRHGTCLGDSGSALVSEKTGRQIGVVSWGYNCAVGAPDVFARISGVKNFLSNFLE